jgi:hypothetical protein
MARYEGSFTGEYRTRSVGIKLTPTERKELESAAAEQGARLSDYVRELCLKREAPVVAATRRNPDAKALLFELSAIGNNLNQLARRANIHDEMPDRFDLEAALKALKAAMARVLAL